MVTTSQTTYEQAAERTRAQRMKWWHNARFGMFIHWGLYSQLGRHEWVMNRERIPLAEYEKLAATWKPKPHAARAWARLAQAAGMKYMVLTTKHHEGFCLWNTQQHDYNAVKQGPGRDLVREYVEACRAAGLKVGFYYSLMDWHHPDGALCAIDEGARRRFVDFTRGCVRELLSNYGKIDILWYDVSWPLDTAAKWESAEINRMARQLQPHLIINNRSQLDEDFGTPEEHIQAADRGRAWEACMTFNGAWGWQKAPPEDWHSARKVLDMLRTCTAGGGNLLLNVGPKSDGSLPPEAVERLTKVGRWLKSYGRAVYGGTDRVEDLEWMPTGHWTRKGHVMYYWVTRWPGRDLAIGGLTEKLVSARLLPAGRRLSFEQTDDRLVLHGLPAACPDKLVGVGMIAMKFKAIPKQNLGAGYVRLDRWMRYLANWHVVGPFRSPEKSRVTLGLPTPVEKAFAKLGAGTVDLEAEYRFGSDTFRWKKARLNANSTVDLDSHLGRVDWACAYGYAEFRRPRDEAVVFHFGSDDGIKVWLNGKVVHVNEVRRGCEGAMDVVTLKLRKGVNRLLVKIDNYVMGWGFKVGIMPRRPAPTA
jgi:alpha-L-fucosidase